MVDLLKKVKLVGEFIRKHRESLGISQRTLGLSFNPPVTTQFISNVERGVTPLPPMHIPILAKALAVKEGELMQLLEKEYALKLNGRLGKAGDLEENGEGSSEFSLDIAHQDYDFIKSLYEAYRTADTRTRQAFSAACESVLNLPKSSTPQ
jgi:transcriptional regulator with XRE-family HTH domain